VASTLLASKGDDELRDGAEVLDMADPIPPPQEVGVRELKNGLSRYLAAVKDGQELIVTDHGKPVARIVPVSRSIDRLAELVAQGKVKPARPGPRYIPKPMEGEGPLSDIVLEQRR
jgi:prevent-host-death family protein